MKLPKKWKNWNIHFLSFTVNFGLFCIFRDPYFGNESYNHQNRVKIRVHGRITQIHKKSNDDFWSIFLLFWSFYNFEDPYLGKVSLSKSQNFCKIRIFRIRFTQKVKNCPKKALLADFHFWQSDTWFSDHSSEIPHWTGSSRVSFIRAHVGAHQSHLCQIAHVPVKYNLFSKFKFVNFWRFFDLDPTWTLNLWPWKYVFWTHSGKFQFCSFTLSKTAMTERASHEQIHYLDFFWTVFWWNWVRIEVKIMLESI